LRPILAILLLGLSLRVALLLGALGIDPIRDEIAYLDLALDWNELGVFHGGQAPGYPWFLAAMMRALGPASLDAVKWVQVLAFAPVVGWSVFALARRLYGAKAAAAAGILWALHLPLAGFTHLHWTETLFLACFGPALLLFLAGLEGDRPAAGAGSAAAPVGAGSTDRAAAALAGAGILLGAAALLKESATWLPPLLALLLIRRNEPGASLRRALTFLLGAAVVVAPWTARNVETHGRLAIVGTTIGENAYLGLNGRYVNFDYTRDLIAAYPEDHWVTRTFSPARDDAWERSDLPNAVDRSAADVRAGIAYMAARPGYFLATRVRKIADAVTPMSFLLRHLHLDLYDGWLRAPAVRRALAVLAPLGVMALLLATVAACCYLPPPPGGRVLLATSLYFAATWLLVSMSRFRAPLLPAMLALSGALLADPGAVRRASRARHCAFAAGAATLAGLWTLNADGVLLAVRGIWER
jgi:hypothetical protein